MPWAKGQSGNVRGRPKSSNALATQVRAQTKNGAELVEFAMSIMRDVAAETSDRMDAMKWLADRGWGKAVETIVLDDERETCTTDIATQQLEAVVGGPQGCIQ